MIEIIAVILSILLFWAYWHLHQVRYYAKSLYYIATHIWIGLSWPYFIVRKTHPNNLRVIYRFYHNLSQVLGLKVNIFGQEHLGGAEEPCVIISNHQSSLDIIALSYLWPANCTILAKKELKYIIPLGFFSYKSGIIYIDRNKSLKSKKALYDLATKMKTDKLKVWIFPEGTRNPSFQMLPFKKGGFHLAVQAQVPICPVVISSYYPFYCKKEKRFEKGQINIMCLPPVTTTGKTVDDVNELIESVRDNMNETFQKISQFA